MAFWGIEVKPGKPFTHAPEDTRGRLHISQATLGTGASTNKSVVQCNVGNKSPVFLCSLFPEKAESCQLNLEFDEADEVVFSVLGPRSVHITGYYLSATRHYKPDDESESYGEDIADTETERSADGSQEDEYEDSFIDDGNPDVIPSSSPISLINEKLDKSKPKNGKESHKRLRRKWQLSESDDDTISGQQTCANGNIGATVLDSESEDMYPISSLYKSKPAAESTRSKAEEKSEKESGKTSKKVMKDDDNCVTVIEEKAHADKDGELRRHPYQCNSWLPSAEVGPKNDAKPKKKPKEQSKEGKPLEAGGEDDFFFGKILKWDKDQQIEREGDKLDQDLPVINEKDQKTANDK